MTTKKDSLKEFIKYYLNDTIFETTFQLQAKIHTMLIGTQLAILILLVIFKIIFKENQTLNNILSWICSAIVWICLLFVIGTNIIIEKVRKKINPRINNFYIYLDALTEDDEFEKEIELNEDEINETSTGN